MATKSKSDNEDGKELKSKTGSEKIDQEERASFFRELLARRVPQFLGGYLAASWIIVEFLDWLVNRYPLSPYLVEFGLVAMASMIPTVALIAYFHGKPGRDRWTRMEKVGIPTNLIITAALLIFLFQGRELGATTTTVIVVDENGEQIERLVPKSEFRKKVALFPFENETGKDSNEWLRNAIPVMANYDLSQDMYLDIISTYDLAAKITEAGLQVDNQIPMTLKRKIAGEHYMDYFTVGTISEVDDQLIVNISLHNRKTSKLLSENTFSGKDVLAMVDEITLQLKDDLEIPLQHIENTEDLPVSELMTISIPALKYFFGGIDAVVLDDDWPGGIELLEKSVQEDETFAFGYLNLYSLYLYANQGQKVVQAIEPLMQHLYKIPERLQYAVKHDYYTFIKQDRTMAMDVAKNWVELYPDDLKAHSVMAMLYMVRNLKDEELAEYKTILSLDPKQYDLLIQIGDLYRSKGELDEAQKYYQQYLDQFPNSLKAYTEIGDMKRLNGDYEEAKSNYNKALLIEPDDLSILLSLAKIESELGNFHEALTQYNEALELCKTPEDSVDVYTNLENYFQVRGQVQKSIEYLEIKLAKLERFAPPLMVLDQKIESIGKYIKAGKSEIAYQIVQETEAQMAPPLDKLIPIMYLDIYLELGEIENAEEALTGMEEAIQFLQMEIMRSAYFEAQGKIHELKEKHELAIESYMKQLELDPTSSDIHVQIGRCYRNIKDFNKAEESIQKTLRIHPFGPKTNYEMALVYAETGKTDKALEHLKIAQGIWEEADSDYKPALLVREKLSELEALAP
jgi:tetratricopeptide (TPR) repeat protein